MGKWAQYAKRGSAKLQGFLTAPTNVDWHMATPGATSVNVHRDSPIPAGADAWNAQVQLQTGGAIVGTFPAGSGTPLLYSGLTTATNYRMRTAWLRGTSQVSDWSAWVNFTTL